MLRRFGVNYAIFCLVVDAALVALSLALAEWWRPNLDWLPYSRPLGPLGDEKLVPLEEAIRRFTSRPAARVGLPDRGVMKPGMKADVTIFDAARIRDVSTFIDPTHYSEGVMHVLVNGKAVVSGGNITAERPGEALRGPGYRSAGQAAASR